MLGSGVSYALASLSCTIAPFVAVVVTAFGAGSVWAGVGLFIAYAMGMGPLVGTAAVAVALANTSLLGRLRRLGRTVPEATGALLVLAGSYVAYYGWWEIRVISGTASRCR
jgi:cytochrome c-type biogenesis protein